MFYVQDQENILILKYRIMIKLPFLQHKLYEYRDN